MYKKYIKKKGKKVGPYYYDSIRLKNGKVKSVYLGSDEKKAKQKLKVLKKESSKAVHKRSSATLKKSLNPRSNAKLIGDHKVHMKDRVFLSLVLILMLVSFMHFGGILDDSSDNAISGGFVTGFRTFSDIARDSFSDENLITGEVIFPFGNKITGNAIFSKKMPLVEEEHNVSLLVSESSEYSLNFEGIEKLTSLKLSGRVASFEGGAAKVFLSDAGSGDTYLVYDSEKSDEGLLGAVGITGSVVLEGVEEVVEEKPKSYKEIVSSLTGFNVVDSKGKIVRYELSNGSNGTSIIDLRDKDVFEIEYPRGDGWIAYEEYSSRGLIEPVNISFERVFGFDFSGLGKDMFNETNTSFSSISEGAYLYGCNFWDFELGICLSDWNYLFDLNKTNNYTVSLTNEVMAFAEGIFDFKEEEEIEEEMEDVEIEEVDLLVRLLDIMNITNYTIDSFDSECKDVCNMKNVLSKNFVLKLYVQDSALELDFIEIEYVPLEEIEYSLTLVDGAGKIILGNNVEPVAEVLTNTVDPLITTSKVGNITEEIVQYGAVVGQPVRWKKKVVLDVAERDIEFELPDAARNITLNKIIDGNIMPIVSASLDEGNGTILNLTDNSEDVGFTKNFLTTITGNAITGMAVSGTAQESIQIQETIVGGNESNETDIVRVDDLIETIEVEYETPGPIVEIKDILRGKRIIVSSAIHYVDILSFVDIPESRAEDVKLYRVLINNLTGKEFKVEHNFTLFDRDGSGEVDYIEWVVPSLSNDTYDVIIEIVAAEHRDVDYKFISDIYNETYLLDDLWSEPIYHDEYVRVTFEENLTNTNDITVYVRNNESSNNSIIVYNEDLTQKITEFKNIDNEGYYKVFLTNLVVSSDVFNLRINNLNNISSAYLEFNHIIDPNFAPNISLTTPKNLTNFATGTAGVELVINVTDDKLPVDNITLSIYGGKDVDPIKSDLLYKLNVTNGTQVTYNWSKQPFNVEGEVLYAYHFDQVKSVGESSTLVYDWANYKSNGTPGGDPEVNYSNAIFGGNFEFDGTGDWITNNRYPEIQTKLNLTIMGWFRSKDLTQQRIIFSSGVYDPTGSANRFHGFFIMQDNSDMTIVHGNGQLAGSVPNKRMVSFFSDTEWHHIAITRWQNGTYNVYKDGVLDSNASTLSNTMYTAAFLNTRLGGGSTASGGDAIPWNGAVDEFIIYNRTMNKSSINATLEMGDATYFWNATGDDTSLVNNTPMWQFTIGAAVSGGDIPPTVTLNSPANGTVYTEVGNITLNATVEDAEDSTLFVRIYGSNGTTSAILDTEDLIYYNESDLNASFVDYNWTAPVLDAADDYLLLAHLDNNSLDFGESHDAIFDFAAADGVQNGSITGTGVIDTSNGKLAGAYSSNSGGSTNRIGFGDQDNWIDSGNISYMFWVKSGDVAQSLGGIFGKSQIIVSGIDHGMNVVQVAADLRITTSEEKFDVDGFFEDTDWHHVAVVFNASRGFTVYTDGKLNSTFGFVNLTANNDHFIIGNRFTSLAYDKPFNGYIDEFAIINRTIGADEVLNAYKLRSGNHTWYYQVNDSGGNKTLSNSQWFVIDRKPNVTSLSFTPTGPNTTLGLNCTFTPYDDLDSTLNATIKWYNGSNTYSTTVVEGMTSGSAYTHNVSAYVHRHYQEWNCSVLTTDKRGSNASKINSTTRSIVNFEPGAPTLNTPINTSTHIVRNPIFNWTPPDEFNILPNVGDGGCGATFFCDGRTSDPDEDQVTYTLNISCTTGPTPCDDNRQFTVTENITNCDANGNSYLDNQDNCTFVLPSDLSYFIDDGKYYTWTVITSDPNVTEPDTPAQWNYNVSVYVAIAVLGIDANFGTMISGDTNETSGCNLATGLPEPCPIWLENAGNTKFDVNLTGPSDALFTAISNPHTIDYFSVKVDNATEGQSFNITDSVVSYTVLPAVGADILLINDFDWNDSVDEVAIDVNVSVPLNETDGAKGTSLAFTGWYYIA